MFDLVEVALTSPPDPQPPQGAGEAGAAHAVPVLVHDARARAAQPLPSSLPGARTRRNHVARLDQGPEERLLEAARDPAEVCRDHPAGTGAFHRQPDREGHGHAHRLGQRVERRSVRPWIRCDDLDLVPARAHLERPAQDASQFVLDGRGREELDALRDALRRYLRAAPIHRVQVASRSLGRRDIPQDPLRDLQANNGIGLEQDGAEPPQPGQKAPFEAALGKARKEEEPGVRGQRVLSVATEHRDGRLQHARHVRAAAVAQQRLVAGQHLRHQGPLVETAMGAGGRVARGVDPTAAQCGGRPAHRVPEAGLLGEFPETGEARRGDHLVDCPLHQGVFVEGVDHRETGPSQFARNDFCCEGT